MFGRLSHADLIDLCRVLRHQLGAGISIQRVLEQQSQRGRGAVRGIAGRLSDAIRQGSNLSTALERESGAFPPLFLAMVKVGETTGHLAEIFGELERYFELELQLKRQFRNQIILPVIQFLFAVAIIAGLIYLLDLITSLRGGGGPPLFTFFGLAGAAGSVAFLVTVFGTLLTLWSICFVVSRAGRGSAWMHRFLLLVPAIGACVYALAMSRFTLALQLTLDSGLSITKALKLSLEATGNAYFLSRADVIVQALKSGNSLQDALAGSGLFESDFMEMVVTSEESGTVPEMMRRLAKQYQEETARNLTVATRVAAGLVWLSVAAFIIWAIFKVFGIYLGALEGKI